MEATEVPQSVAGYNVGVKLGTGSFATVYKGTSLAPRANGVRETVAIKCIDRRSAIATKISSDNVVSEIAILKRMKHRHIVQLLDFQWDKKYIYMIIEFCGGGDLSSFIRLHQCLPERVAQKFFRQLASAIKYFRSFNIAHMDLKPQNILLTSHHRPILKVADFGFAQHLREESGQGHSFRGSPLYMAPEIFTRQKYDARVDLWSCGVILYECLYGKAPFACASMDELIKQITSHESIKLPNTVPLSDDCVDLLKGLLVRNPSHRMSFDDFFSHPFVDLDHAPSDASLERANSLIVKSDTAYSEGNHVEAVKLIAEAVALYLPALQLIDDELERQRMRTKVHGYLRRAEYLKKELLRPDARAPDSARSSPDKIDLLEELWSDTPQVRASILVATKAEEFETAEKWTDALDRYQLAIEAMLQILNREPPGRRKDVLRRRVERWLKRAEQLQLYVEVGALNLSKVAETEKADEAVDEDTEQLAKQHQCVVQ